MRAAKRAANNGVGNWLIAACVEDPYLPLSVQVNSNSNNGVNYTAIAEQCGTLTSEIDCDAGDTLKALCDDTVRIVGGPLVDNGLFNRLVQAIAPTCPPCSPPDDSSNKGLMAAAIVLSCAAIMAVVGYGCYQTKKRNEASAANSERVALVGQSEDSPGFFGSFFGCCRRKRRAPAVAFQTSSSYGATDQANSNEGGTTLPGAAPSTLPGGPQ